MTAQTQTAKHTPVVHLRVVRRGPFGGTVTTSRCNRLRTLADGMNLSDDPKSVTCKFCRADIAKATGAES